MSGSSSPKKSNLSDTKFYFDRNNFDSPEDTREEDVPPPPPTFTEDELAAAKAASFEEGKNAGLQDAAHSREQQIAQTLNVIAEQFSGLFAAEQIRENLYERESIRLAQTMLNLILPGLNERFGNAEILSVIENTLKDFNQKTAISIYVPEDMRDDIEKHLLQKWPDEETRPRFRLSGDAMLAPGSCEMNWEDGGAVRHADELIKKIQAELDKLLPPEPKTEISRDQEETGDSPDAENNVITKGKDSLESPAKSAQVTGDNHE